MSGWVSGIAESAIEFQYLWPVWREDKPGEKTALIFNSLAEHAIDDGDKDIPLDLGENCGR